MRLRQLDPPPYVPPYSFQAGIEGILPGGEYFCRVFPKAFSITSLKTNEETLFSLQLANVIKDFKVSFDLLHHMVIVEGRDGETFFRYFLKCTPEGLFFVPKKQEMTISESKVAKGQSLKIIDASFPAPSFPTPRLLLGSFKTPSWDRPKTLLDILPHWYMVARGMSLPFTSKEPSLVTSFAQAIKENNHVFAHIEELYLATCRGFFVSNKEDILHRGYPRFFPEGYPLERFHEDVRCLLRTLFIQEEGDTILLLPYLPKELSYGKLLREQLSSSHIIDIEWRKGNVRRVLLHAKKEDDLRLAPSNQSSYFVRRIGSKDMKKRVEKGELFHVKAHECYLFDNFAT